ncbi:MAG: hypothetical protein IJP79_07230 [Paludibacteraceae bacterium]|nr:hypothetical protein [Paludibacteraceae bacterium]MBQ6963476.1 hypothetical protein [Paludibacteraceae bacterium]MBQ7748265.1 hypothetical protein [Paludibacteraceae bacterium]
MYNLCIPSYSSSDDKKNEVIAANKDNDDKIRNLMGFGNKKKKRKK